MSLGVSAGTKSMTFVISRILVAGGASETDSTTTPTSDLLRNGTRTRLPGCTDSRRAPGIAYVNVLRRGTGSATLQKGKLIAACSVSGRRVPHFFDGVGGGLGTDKGSGGRTEWEQKSIGLPYGYWGREKESASC